MRREAIGRATTFGDANTAVAVAHVTQCLYWIRGHTKATLRHRAFREEIIEAIWVAASRR